MNGWLSVAGDRLIVPVGMSNPPALLALGLPRSSAGPRPAVAEERVCSARMIRVTIGDGR